MIIILVDYDNIPLTKRRKGLNHLIESILLLFDVSKFSKVNRILVRLYGGWYKLNVPTKAAQNLTVEIQNEFPKIRKCKIGSKVYNITINLELAYSLAIEPGLHLWHTFRPRSIPNNIVCLPPKSVGCKDKNCQLQNVYEFIKNNECPKTGCNITPENILSKPAQKLVDSMMTVDLIYYTIKNEYEVCIVTSDDDQWPGIKYALLNGATILHVHTHSSRLVPYYYLKNVGNNYIQKNL